MPEDAVRECPPDEDSENDDILRDGPSPGSDADVAGDTPVKELLVVGDVGSGSGGGGGGQPGHAGRRTGRTTPDVSTGGRY